MSGLSRIVGAAEALKAPSVAVLAKLCTHRHHQASSCRRCVDACPSHAISVSAEGPSVDALSCADCGACVSACPTGALAALRPTDRALAERIAAAAASAEELTIACARARGEQAGGVTVRCLARLDPSLLLLAFAHGAGSVTLRDACGTCAIKEVSEQVTATAAGTAQVLDVFALPGRVLLEERERARDPAQDGGPGPEREAERKAGREPEREPGLEAEREAGPEPERESRRPRRFGRGRSRPPRPEAAAVTRRGFFDMLRHGGTYAAATAAGVLAGQIDAVIDEGPRRELLARVPSKRERLLGALRTVVQGGSAPSEADRLFEAPRLDRESCDGCGLCGRLCPTGALTITENEAGAVLAIASRPEACVACGLCVEVCGRQALALAPLPAARLLAPPAEPVTLFESGSRATAPLHVSFEDKMQQLLGVPVYRS